MLAWVLYKGKIAIYVYMFALFVLVLMCNHILDCITWSTALTHLAFNFS